MGFRGRQCHMGLSDRSGSENGLIVPHDWVILQYQVSESQCSLIVSDYAGPPISPILAMPLIRLPSRLDTLLTDIYGPLRVVPLNQVDPHQVPKRCKQIAIVVLVFGSHSASADRVCLPATAIHSIGPQSPGKPGEKVQEGGRGRELI